MLKELLRSAKKEKNVEQAVLRECGKIIEDYKKEGKLPRLLTYDTKAVNHGGYLG